MECNKPGNTVWEAWIATLTLAMTRFGRLPSQTDIGHRKEMNAMNHIKTRDLTTAAIIAALYATITHLLAFFSFGPIQVRVAEALTLLPLLTPAAVPGLFVGCLISNLVGGISIFDKVLGPLATLLAAFLSWKLKRMPPLAALPPVVVNAIVVGAVLYIASTQPGSGIDPAPYLAFAGWVGTGQVIACYALGLPLYYALKRLPGDVFHREK